MTIKPPVSLIKNAGVNAALELSPVTEAAWVEVVQKMESVYADLVQTQVEIEEKNSAFEEAQQFIRSVLYSMTDVLIVCDLRGEIEQVNRALESLIGKSASELHNRPLASIFGDESQAFVRDLPRNLEVEALIDRKACLLSSEQGLIPLAINCSHRYDSDGNFVGWVIIGRPVGDLQRAYQELNLAHEELKQAQIQLIQSEKMASLGRLVAGVAHELNNPISFVFGNMHALQSYGERINRYLTAVDEETESESLKRLRDELKITRIMGDMDSLIDGTLEGAERVRDIVQDLLCYSTTQQESVCQFDLKEVVVTSAEWVAKACRIKPPIDYEMPEAVIVTGRKGHVQQILMNLIQNAVDVMADQPSSRMVIGCKITDSDAIISIRDHGPGIPQQALTKLFDPFYTTKPVGKGTGLGLSISYGLATDMGGELTAKNHREGGAVFSLRLPLRGIDNG